MNKSQKEFYRQFSQHGTGDARIEISASEVALLLFITYHDLYDTFPSQEFPAIGKLARKDFYKITFEEISSLPQITSDECFYLLEKAGVTTISDSIYLYLKNLAIYTVGVINMIKFYRVNHSLHQTKLPQGVSWNMVNVKTLYLQHG